LLCELLALPTVSVKASNPNKTLGMPPLAFTILPSHP
jgi:hypothetical protein